MFDWMDDQVEFEILVEVWQDMEDDIPGIWNNVTDQVECVRAFYWQEVAT